MRGVQLEGWVFTFDYAERTLKDHFKLLSLDGWPARHWVWPRRARFCTISATPRSRRSITWTTLVLRPRRGLVLGRPYVRIGRNSVCRREQGIDADPRARSDCHGHGRAPAAPAFARALARSGRNGRLDGVEQMLKATIARAGTRKVLASILDLERLLAKVTIGWQRPRELRALGCRLERIPRSARRCPMTCARIWPGSRRAWTKCLSATASYGLSDDPPVNPPTAPIRDGCSATLDENCATSTAISNSTSPRSRCASAANRHRVARSPLRATFLVTTSRSQNNVHLAPADYQRKQTLVNAERFTTPELKGAGEQDPPDAEERILALEREIFQELRAFAAAQAARIRSVGGGRDRRRRGAGRGGRGGPLHAPAGGQIRRNANPRRPSPGDRKAHRARGVAFHPERFVAG